MKIDQMEQIYGIKFSPKTDKNTVVIEVYGKLVLPLIIAFRDRCVESDRLQQMVITSAIGDLTRRPVPVPQTEEEDTQPPPIPTDPPITEEAYSEQQKAAIGAALTECKALMIQCPS